jgi:anti-anti-sigma factor
MEISATRAADQTAVLRLAGRLDANWCQTVQDAITAAIRAGDHRLRLDLAAVPYISSAGLRVLLTAYKQLRAIKGEFSLGPVSPEARTVLDLAGLAMLLAPAGVTVPAPAMTPASSTPDATDAPPATHSSARATYELHTLSSASTTTGPISLQALGDPAGPATAVSIPPLQKPFSFGPACFALGLGALGPAPREASARLGEFLAIAGAAVFQPTDGSARPDFALCQAGFIPQGHLPVGLRGDGAFPRLARFSVAHDASAVPLTELAATALELSGAEAVALVLYAETAGLVGATLRKPLDAAPPDRFAFPQVRDWLSFTTERAHRDTTSLVVGVVARPGHKLSPWLRPLAKDVPLRAHFHAAAFPYRPIRKGRLELPATIADLFENSTPQALLHLLADNRDIHGIGESEFHRGALWFAPVS